MNSIVSKQIKVAYESLVKPEWEYEEYKYVFRMFFDSYTDYFGKEHPHMKTETIRHIMEELPYCEDSTTNYGSAKRWLSCEDYEELIPKYFETEFDDCNYSMAHFVSGNIRILRCYETGV